jgi:hypothetical protein
VTLDLDWACEPAVEDLLGHLCAEGIPATVFVTHRSPMVEARLGELEVGLHPHFGADSSHGPTLAEVVRHVLALRHNLPAFRCHRFAVSNEIRGAMTAAGMRVSSNVCADVEAVPPFRDRFGLLEIPVFLEDGGYLHRGHPLDIAALAAPALDHAAPKVLLLHPMHFAVNTPHFTYMTDIKQTVTRLSWHGMTRGDLDALRWRGRGVRDFIVDLLDLVRRRGLQFTTLGAIAEEHGALGAKAAIRHPPG